VRGGDTLCACSFMYSVQFGHGGRRCTVDATRGHPRQVSAETATRLTPDHGRPRWAADAAPGGSAARAVTASLYIRHACIQDESHACLMCLRSEVVLL
jgi:hypothetical protein